jgi:hypothetical protein
MCRESNVNGSSWVDGKVNGSLWPVGRLTDQVGKRMDGRWMVDK